MPLASLIAAAVLQGIPLSEDPEVLHGYMAHACRVQQASNQGGMPEDYAGFCDCLSADLAENSSEALYRSMALGSQGALQDNAMVDDWEAAREESERVFGGLEPEEQLSAANVIQNGLMACIALAPAQSE
ncbi:MULTISPECIES: hypothetical protein [Hyphobacterium]|uniref:Uncharacterized protein n=1 Tax=Hyphobacterium vulgare TaxID=1736751 RepID=A0ABV6ZYQ2_9PROT